MLKVGQLVEVFSGCKFDGHIGVIYIRDPNNGAYRVNFSHIVGFGPPPSYVSWSWFNEYELGNFEPVQT